VLDVQGITVKITNKTLSTGSLPGGGGELQRHPLPTYTKLRRSPQVPSGWVMWIYRKSAKSCQKGGVRLRWTHHSQNSRDRDPDRTKPGSYIQDVGEKNGDLPKQSQGGLQLPGTPLAQSSDRRGNEGYGVNHTSSGHGR